MFEKLKKLIFDESVELEPQEELYDVVNDSLESNKNLIKSQPYKKHDVHPEKSEPEVVEVVENKEEDFVFKRIDVQEIKIEEPEVKPIIKRESVKPVKRKVASNPQYYKPRPIISPMFGVSQVEDDRSQLIETFKKPVKPTSDDSIISPMYGVVTAEQEIVTKHTKQPARRKRSQAVNLSLEEMLNMQSNEELEFTLFDVKLDRDEFQSRENKIIDENKE